MTNVLIHQQMKQYRSLNKWFQTPLGVFAANEFTTLLDTLPFKLQGDTLLQLGACGDNQWLNKFAFSHKWIASPFALNNKIDLQGEFNHLPLQQHSIDCVVAPLSLEPFNLGTSLLDEIDRVLSPMGHVVLFCINPLSLWGSALKLNLLHCYHDRPVKLRTPLSLNRLFAQRGFQQVALINFCYLPPVNKSSWIKKLTFLDEIGKMLWPVPSAFYCLIARKYQIATPSYLVDERNVLEEYNPPLPAVTFKSS